MSTTTIGQSALPASENFFLARQPILDRRRELIGYELLFRHAEHRTAHIVSDIAATASVISHTAQIGIENVVGTHLAFLNVDAEGLMSNIFQFLPRDKIVLEILENTVVTPELLSRIAELVKHGFRFALDDVISLTRPVQQLLPYIDIVKLDFKHLPVHNLAELVSVLKKCDKKLLAEKVETHQEFELCLDLGFDYFQGYHFARPLVLSGRRVSPRN